MPAPPWNIRAGIDNVVDQWLERGTVRRCFTADRSLAAERATHAPFPDDLEPALTEALAARGLGQLYRHQRDAIDQARSGRHVVIATPTASGKSLCFHLPVLDAIARDPTATAIYLYPTKALARDQEQSIRGLIGAAGLDIGATVYDGDTPGDARRAARQRAQLVLTNPDMLHTGILPAHASWARCLQNLRYVVVDELHTYRGVFGSHVAHVLGRLRRIAAFHGSTPTFIGATATIDNPTEHAARLIGVPPTEVSLIDSSTAPRGARRVFVYNPPVVNAELGIRASYLHSAVRLAADLVAARVRTIVFGQSRNTVEIMLKYLRDRFIEQPSIRDAIVAYRGGYLPDQRRKVERGLREGKVLCVVATSALELGIDIGDLDAVVCAGYPGSLAETWQRFGRAGRRGDASIAVLVASSSPLDQYLATHPQQLLDGTVEQARLDPDNAEILVQHLKCAAFELPFRRREPFGTLPRDDTEAALDFLAEHGVVHRSRNRYHWSSDAFPANHVSLRRVGWDNFVIIDEENGETLAELDWHSAPGMLHEQAIYQHDGRQYQVELLDYDNHKAYVRQVEPDYFTTALRHVKVRVIEVEAEAPLVLSSARGDWASGDWVAPPLTHEPQSPLPPGVRGVATVGWGEVSVTEKVVGYKKVKFHTHENAGYGDVRLPDIEMHTTSFWLTVPADVGAALGRATAIEGLKGLAHALKIVATLALMCDQRDIGRAIDDCTEDNSSDHEWHVQFCATAFLYDAVPGGVGMAERIHERSATLVGEAAEMIARCSCSFGCPTCVGATTASAAPVGHSPADSALDRKAASRRLLRRLGLLVPARAGASTEGVVA
ncbi:MAG: DEAD/DEAH box helicase [Deltaproteobacteria bacterium]|nr:DEAD/DEAH box helicase [Deltaproteobacteria bacterium]